VGDEFLTSFVTSNRGKIAKSGVAKKTVGVFKNVLKKTQTREENSFHMKSVGQDPKIVKKYLKIVHFLGCTERNFFIV